MDGNKTDQPKRKSIRARRLASDQRRLDKLARISDLISVVKTRGSPPDLYVVRFTCRGIARIEDDKPVFSERHEVQIELPRAYPTLKPLMRWLTPIFHPNIESDGSGVCVSEWYPTRFLDDLCVTLGYMIQYKNYNPHSCLNFSAGEWIKNHDNIAPVDRRPLRRGEEETGDNDALARIRILESP